MKVFSKNMLYKITEEPQYVMDGLVLMLDGINNTRNGHSSSSNVWEDLSGNDNDITMENIVWNNNNAEFNGTNSVGTGSKRTYQNGFTMEIVYDYDIDTTGSYCGLVGYSYGGSSGNYMRPAIYIENNVFSYLAYGNDTYGARTYDISNVSKNVIHYMAMTKETTGYAIFDNNSYATTNLFPNDMTFPRQTKNKFRIGVYGSGQDTVSPNTYLKGKIYAIRLYDRFLTLDEIEHNRNIDRNRFNF